MREGNDTAFFNDEDFQDRLVALLVQDHRTLRDCGALLHPNDFKPLKGMRRGRPRWVIAERALEYYQKHHEPLGKLLRSDVLDYANRIGLGSEQVNELKTYLQFLQNLKLTAPDSLTEKVVRFKREHIKATAIDELVELQAANLLTDEKWSEINRRALASVNSNGNAVDYLSGVTDRNRRRSLAWKHQRVPWTYIDPLDSMIRTVGPKQMGLVLAPYKRGKSLFLQWLAVAFISQRMNTLYITLENPQRTVEDRLDSIITYLPIKELNDYPQAIERRFSRFRVMINAGLRIYDGTEGGVSVAKIEQIIQNERSHGFIPQALIIDYDKELVPRQQYRELRFAFDEIYRDLRQLTAQYNLVTWTASQTQRKTRHLKVISGDVVGEDIGKIQKVTCALGLGRGDWSDDSIFIWVAAHNDDRQEIGCEIIPDLKRMLIYDREATRRAYKEHQPEEENE